MRLFPNKIPIGINKWWIGFTDDGRPLYESRFYALNRLNRISRYPNTTSTIYPTVDGRWIWYEDGFGGKTCSGTATGATISIGDDHRIDPAQYYDGGLDFDTSPVGTDTVSSAILSIYADSYSKTKTLNTTYSVGYDSKKSALSSPMVCGDNASWTTAEGGLNWAGSTGFKNMTIAVASINASGHTSFLLTPNWAHVAAAEHKLAVWRGVGYTGTTSDPYLTVIHAGATTFTPRLTLLGVG